MCINLARSQAFPFAIRYSSKPRCFHQFHSPKPYSLNPTLTTNLSYSFINFIPSSTKLRVIRNISTWQQRSVGIVRTGNSLPWLKGGSVVNAVNGKRTISPWQKSLQSLEKVSGETTHDDKMKMEESSSSYKKGGGRRLENNRSDTRKMRSAVEAYGSSTLAGRKNVRDYSEKDGNVQDEPVEVSEAVVNNPRWDKIKPRRGELPISIMGRKNERPEFQRWNNQDNWGRRTWKEATESTLPKIVGQGVYGVGPVLAALSAGRRELYALYVQQGLDLTSSNTRKKRDKKGLEKVLKMAEKIGLSITDVSKHDLNMIADNRPHQGLILDASPLEMVPIKELETVSPGEEKQSLWVALDEVTDPQNLGAIIRSAYYFGASGVVLCAKNSAPLSGVVSKASAGSLELMELRYCKNMMQFLVLSAENGWRVIGGSISSRAVPLNEIAPGEPTILVLGSEGTGLRPLVERSCTQLVCIPGNISVDVATGGESDAVDGEETNNLEQLSTEEFQSFMAVESLNVSVAAGVLIHQLIGNQRKDDIV
ncbi:rRNA methyltransferase 1, mitochondrial [Linum perenne]